MFLTHTCTYDMYYISKLTIEYPQNTTKLTCSTSTREGGQLHTKINTYKKVCPLKALDEAVSKMVFLTKLTPIRPRERSSKMVVLGIFIPYFTYEYHNKGVFKSFESTQLLEVKNAALEGLSMSPPAESYAQRPRSATRFPQS